MRTPVVVLPVLTGKQALAWDALMAVAADLGEGWTLIGGQMVLLHQAERRPAGADPASGAGLRWSYDLDVVVNLRTSRTRMSHIDSVLGDHGLTEQILPVGHRYVDAAGTVFDVLAPDHLGRHLPRLDRGNTLQAAGGTQALKRSELVEVEYNQQRAPIDGGHTLVGAAKAGIALRARQRRRQQVTSDHRRLAHAGHWHRRWYEQSWIRPCIRPSSASNCCHRWCM